MDRTITAPIDRETLKSLHAGDYVYISGTIYARRGQLLTKRFFIKSLLHFCLEIRYPIGSNSVETHVILQEGIFG